MAGETSDGKDFGECDVPFLFVPHGQPEPTEWMAKHPGWVKIPATLMPRDAPRAPALPTLVVYPGSLGTAAAEAGAAEGLSLGAAIEMAATSAAGLVAEAAGPLAMLGVLLPTRTAPPEMDELSPELRRTLGHGTTEALTVPAPNAPVPGLVPPSASRVKPGEGGFTPSPPMPDLPGFTPAPPQSHVRPGPAAAVQGPTIVHKDRNQDLHGGARTNSPRARKAAKAADPAVTKVLAEAEWRAHHLINLAAIRGAKDLIAEAVRAGWKTDDVGNVVPLPKSVKAQKKLNRAQITRPVHDSGHNIWNAKVREELQKIERNLKELRLSPGTDTYARAAKQALEKLQKGLRQKLLNQRRITQNDKTASTEPV